MHVSREQKVTANDNDPLRRSKRGGWISFQQLRFGRDFDLIGNVSMISEEMSPTQRLCRWKWKESFGEISDVPSASAEFVLD